MADENIGEVATACELCDRILHVGMKVMAMRSLDAAGWMRHRGREARARAFEALGDAGVSVVCVEHRADWEASLAERGLSPGRVAGDA